MAGIHLRDARAPEGLRLYAIGDIHGRLDLLAAMHRTIIEEIEHDRPADWRVIHLGDYVDRGPDSKGVIDFLIAAQKCDQRNIMLAGNHDLGFHSFLEEADGEGLFARHGGKETAGSYGVAAKFYSTDALRITWAELRCQVPGKHRDFLQSLKFSDIFGDFFFCHAGIRPGVALDRQDPQDLVWIRDVFHNHAGLYEKIIVHGHTPTPEAEILPNRVNLDTYAWHSGRLTALVIDGAAKNLLTVMETGAVQRSEAVTP